jgi:hypothetical protein
MKIKTVKMIDCSEWDDLVKKTYGKTYCFQQQDGCKSRGIFNFTVPDLGEDFENDSIAETLDEDRMGVSFAAWLARDPKKKLENQEYDWELGLWWDRNFYPNFQMVANDLHEKGLLEAGDYTIDIDW